MDTLVKTTVNSLILDNLSEDKIQYLKSTEEKHFVPEKAAGSLFTEVKTLRELLELTLSQRGHLDGDDKTSLIQMGVPENALLSFCRYFIVQTPGEVGIIRAQELPEEQEVYVVKMKPDIENDGIKSITPPSLITAMDQFPQIDFGVIVIGPREEGNSSGGEMVWTCHPGLPIRPKLEGVERIAGSILTAGYVEETSPGSWISVKRSSEIDEFLKKYNF